MFRQKTQSYKGYMALGLAFLWFVLLSACSRGPSSPMKIKMSISPEPIVGRAVNLHIEVESKVPAPNTILTVTLPSGVELVNGDLNWQGELAADQPVSIDQTIRVIAEGEWPIGAYAFSSDAPGSRFGFGGGKGLYVRSSADAAEVIDSADLPKTPIPVIQFGPGTPRPPTPGAATP